MPRSAIASGAADFVLPVREIAARLPELIANRGRVGSEATDEAEAASGEAFSGNARGDGRSAWKWRRKGLKGLIPRREMVWPTITCAIP